MKQAAPFLWDEEKLNRLAAMRTSGTPIGDIAKVFGVQLHVIDYALTRYKLRGLGPGRKVRAEPKPSTTHIKPTIDAPGWPTRAQMMARR